LWSRRLPAFDLQCRKSVSSVLHCHPTLRCDRPWQDTFATRLLWSLCTQVLGDAERFFYAKVSVLRGHASSVVDQNNSEIGSGRIVCSRKCADQQLKIISLVENPPCARSNLGDGNDVTNAIASSQQCACAPDIGRRHPRIDFDQIIARILRISEVRTQRAEGRTFA